MARHFDQFPPEMALYDADSPRARRPAGLPSESIVSSTEKKVHRLGRLYHLTQEHSWDGKALLAELIEQHGRPGKDLAPEQRAHLAKVLTLLMWGELAAWNISADLALEIDDVDAKLAATGQVFDEGRHFYVLRDYITALQGEQPLEQAGGLVRKLLRTVLNAPTLATKLVGMQLLFETNAVVIFRRLQEAELCPVLSGILPYLERDESRHVGLGVMYLPRLVTKMSRAEAARTALFQTQCIGLLMATGLTMRDTLEALDLDGRVMAERVTRMQDDVLRQMVDQHGRGVRRALGSPKDGIGPQVLDFLHPPGGMRAAPERVQRANRRLVQAAQALDRALS